MKAERIREIRQSKGLTLLELSEKTGYTTSYISKIERNLKTPSIEVLKKIADSLNVPALVFFMEGEYKYSIAQEGAMTQHDDKYCLIKSEDREKCMISGETIEVVTPIIFNDQYTGLLGYFNYVPPKTEKTEELTVHPGEESIIVVKGAVEMCFEDKELLLEKGDSIYIGQGVPHTFYNSSDEEAILITYQRKL